LAVRTRGATFKEVRSPIEAMEGFAIARRENMVGDTSEKKKGNRMGIYSEKKSS